MTNEKRIDDKNLEAVSGGAEFRSALDPQEIPNPPDGGGGNTGTGEVQPRPDGDQSSKLD